MMTECQATKAALSIVCEAEAALAPIFSHIEETEFGNQARVLAAFQKEGVAQRHFVPSSGYGYDDIGRDTLDRVFAASLETEDALVRPHLTSGTHAIFTALAGLLVPGETMLSATGKPYDTLEKAIGIAGDAKDYGSLRQLGIGYTQVDLKEDGIDVEALLDALTLEVKLVYFQRSRGYAWRNALLPEAMEPVFSAIKKRRPDVCIVVDNCYGTFTRPHEPSYYGADVIVGSLIKNAGGGIAPTGGYIAGRADCILRIAQRLTVPGMGREVGSYMGGYTPFYEGLFIAPHVTAQSLKTAVLFAKVFEMGGMTSMPASAAERGDIVQAIRFQTPEALCAFIRSIQKASPVDSYVVPEPWDMPGYTSQVIMAAGAFIQGSSIELSADAPIKAPYTAYVQGGLTYSHGKLGVIAALAALIEAGEFHVNQ